jgi:dCTP diphosphatase
MGFDLETSIKALLEFRKERDWEQFHTPKNLSMSITVECAELMEHFQWMKDREVTEYLNTDRREKVEEEIADIASYLLLLANDLEIDLNKAILQKIEKNKQKYPIEKSRGRYNKYNDL